MKFYNKNKNRGGVMILTVLFFLIMGIFVVSGASFMASRDIGNMNSLLSGETNFYVAESGVEDVIYRMENLIPVSSNTLTIDDKTANVTVNTGNGSTSILALSSTNNFFKRIQASMILGTGISFHYAVQAGNGGFSLANTSSITGNVYSNGPVIGVGNNIYGDVVSSGQNGLVYGIHATGSVYSHTIGSSTLNATTIDKDAYYKNITSNTAVSGIKYSNSSDQGTTSLPISDEQIQKWENDALAGGIMSSSSCDSYDSSSNTCTISTNKTLGPKKIPFNLLVKSSQNTLTVAGALWITGNIDLQTKPIIKMISSLGSQNVAVIADNPANTTGSGIVTVGQGATFLGSGSPGSFVFIISQNNSAETGGSTDAISMDQGASALVVFASHGQISMSQSVSVKEITAYRINLSNTANVTYDTGLPSTIFSSGPSGGYNVTNWGEI